MEKTENIDVTLGDGIATLRRGRSSQVTVARILAIEYEGDQERIHLDRLVHPPEASGFRDWSVSGAFATVLSRPNRLVTANAR